MSWNLRLPGRRITWLNAIGLLLLALAGGSGAAHAQDETTIKQAAVAKIREYGPVFLETVQERYFIKKGEQLAWFRDVFLCIIPLLAFFGVALYPLVRSQRIRARLPNPPIGRLFRLYLTQGTILMVILIVLGFTLLFLQFWMSLVGSLSNPQFMLEQQVINHVVEHSDELVNNYTAIFTRVADNLVSAPDMPMLSIILQNGRELRDDPLLGAVIWLLQLLWPLLSNFFLIVLLLVSLSFLRRLWPDVRRMVRFPLDLIAAERMRGPLPVGAPGFAPPGPGYPPGGPPGYPPPGPGGPAIPAPSNSVSAQMWAEGRRLIWLELRVVGVFLIAASLLALLMGGIIAFFLLFLVELLVNVFSVAMLYFVSSNGASSIIALVIVLIGVFLVECIILLGVIFFLLIRRTMGLFRRRFQREIMWREAWRLLGRQLGRFGLVAGLTVAVGILTVTLADWTGGFVIADLGQQGLGLLIVPIILLVGFNLGFWLGRGPKILRSMV